MIYACKATLSCHTFLFITAIAANRPLSFMKMQKISQPNGLSCNGKRYGILAHSAQLFRLRTDQPSRSYNSDFGIGSQGQILFTPSSGSTAARPSEETSSSICTWPSGNVTGIHRIILLIESYSTSFCTEPARIILHALPTTET